MKRLLEPAFNERNIYVSHWVLKLGVLFVIFGGSVNSITKDLSRELARVDANLRDVSWKQMRSVCFTDNEIKHYWYKQEFSQTPDKVMVLVRGREALCGGKGSCGCKTKKNPKGSV